MKSSMSISNFDKLFDPWVSSPALTQRSTNDCTSVGSELGHRVTRMYFNRTKNSWKLIPVRARRQTFEDEKKSNPKAVKKHMTCAWSCAIIWQVVKVPGQKSKSHATADRLPYTFVTEESTTNRVHSEWTDYDQWYSSPGSYRSQRSVKYPKTIKSSCKLWYASGGK